ncbi:MAG: alpha/beta fold hydrolase, partial [Candidatus Limnocylindrales bacterium]
MSGLSEFAVDAAALIGKLSARARTCAYDRAGYGESDPAPDKPRDLDDVTDDLHALLEAAEITGPYILVGSSFGGMIVTYYAHRFAGGIDGVVTLDVPAPSAELSLEDIPELAWDHPENPEHVDVIPEFEGRLAREQFAFKAPLVVITATDGQSDGADQAFWLDWSAESRQVEIEGGHGVYQDSPNEVADEILSLI